MLHGRVKFAYAVLMTISAAMAFVVLRDFDEYAVIGLGPSYSVSLSATNDGAPGARVAEMIEHFADEHGVNVARLYLDPQNDSIRRIHLSVGDPHAESTRWLEHGYPNFSQQATVEPRPYHEIANIHPHGNYFVFGPEHVAAELVGEFERLGYHGQIEPVFSLNTGIGHFADGGLLWSFILVAFVVVLAVASGVTLNAKSYGIQRLQGRSYAMILWQDIVQLAKSCSAFAGIVCVITVCLLFIYNGLNQFATFSLVALCFVGIYTLAAFATHVITLALVHREPVLNAIKGKATANWTVAGSYSLRIAAIALIFPVAFSMMVSGLALNEHRESTQVWNEVGDAYYMRIGGPVLFDEQVDNDIGEWIRSADTRHEAALAWRHGHDSLLSGTNGQDVLVVNNRYLDNHEIYDTAGTKVRTSKENRIRVLVPQRYGQESGDIVARVADWAESQAARTGNDETPEVQLAQIRDGQTAISYARSHSRDDLLLDDPVIIVVTGASGVIPNDGYTSIASRGEILFEDHNRAMSDLGDAGLDPYVLGMSPFAQEAADQYREVRREFGVHAFNLLAAMAVIVITALALSSVYLQHNAQTLFVKYISGWGFLRTHRWVLAAESVLLVTFMAWTWHNMQAAINSYSLPGGGPPPTGMLPLQGWEPVVAGGIALLSLALFVLALWRTNATFDKTHAASVL